MNVYVLLFGGISVAIIYSLRNVGRRASDLPPGPPTLPLIGNLHLMPERQPHQQFKKWADEYGSIYSLILGTSVMIVLSSDTAVKDLLDKRSNNYSSRPTLYIGQVLSGGLRMLLMPYNDTWRMIRRTVHNHLNIRSARSYIPYQDLESLQMLLGVLETPDRWDAHLRRFTNSMTTQMVFGFRTTDIDDAKMHQLFDGFADFSECIMSPAARLIDMYSFVKYLPEFLVPVKRKARKLHEEEMRLFKGHWLVAKEKALNGTAIPCVCVDLVKSQQTEAFSDDLAAYISGSLLEAGSDTTYSTLVGWVQAMVLYPDVARAAQAEIDKVCGDHLPGLADESNMPYIHACVKETLRWMPTVTMGVPHAVIRDDLYNGYRIPKGATVVVNVWGISRDENRHAKPSVFDPTRYIDDRQSAAESALDSDPANRDHFVFGAGRRVCQGMHIADRSLFLAISRMLWAFDFEAVQGETINPSNLTEGMFVKPDHFEARIAPRSHKRAEAVRSQWLSAKEQLEENGQWKCVPAGIFDHQKG
ncbi:cytochrome P450 [Lophiostoma macrostomum CBS 122681]|uniref:Cytochrome P450 n=1 Tax=Lophiostoma macrostomum CBS 122681 TaxID=1314788 RepID=A0A6A6T3G8_9PLEO|nr:cytochrome P450 [Lophiostoma macrostomum CBS 122681]